MAFDTLNLTDDFINNRDQRMRFRNSTDPIYVAFDYIDSQPISKLAESFVKETISDIITFVSSVVRN